MKIPSLTYGWQRLTYKFRKPKAVKRVMISQNVLHHRKTADDIIQFKSDTNCRTLLVLCDKIDTIAALTYFLSERGMAVDMLFRFTDVQRIGQLNAVEVFIGSMARFNTGWYTRESGVGLFIHVASGQVNTESVCQAMGRVRSKDRSVCVNGVLKINNGQDVSEIKEAA